VSITATIATAARVLGQLRRDRRTLAMVFLVAPALLALFKYIFNNQPHTFDRIGAPMIGLFPLIMMFLITSIAMLRERTSGTLERLMSLPLAKLDLLLGYALAFALLAALQGAITGAVGFGLLNVQARGASWAVVLLAIMNALLGMTLGLFLSAFASTEFQAVQFLPAGSSRAATCPTRSRSSPTPFPSPTPMTRSPRSLPTTPAPGSGSTSSSSAAASPSRCSSARPPSGAAPPRQDHVQDHPLSNVTKETG
jgi:ABC-type transport system involved in cytochrome c biogenesis permease component